MYFGVHLSAQLQHKMFYLSSFCQTLGHGGLLWGLTSNPSDPCTSLPGNILLSRQAVPRGHSPGAGEGVALVTHQGDGEVCGILQVPKEVIIGWENQLSQPVPLG